MNTTELINEVARRTKPTAIQLGRKEVEHVVNLMLDVMREELSQPEGNISIPNFGILEVDKRVRTRGSSGQLMNTSGGVRDVSRTSYHIRFKPANALKLALKDTLKHRL